MPETFRTAAKAWVGLIGAVLVAVVATLGTDTPRWLAVVVAVVTAIGVYLTPNAAPADNGDGAGDVGDDLGDH